MITKKSQLVDVIMADVYSKRNSKAVTILYYFVSGYQKLRSGQLMVGFQVSEQHKKTKNIRY